MLISCTAWNCTLHNVMVEHVYSGGVNSALQGSPFIFCIAASHQKKQCGLSACFIDIIQGLILLLSHESQTLSLRGGQQAINV